MSAEHVRNLLLKRAWIVLTFTACGLVGALVGTAFMTPMYRATVTMQAVVSPETPNTYALLVQDRFIGTEAHLANSATILNAVVKQYRGMSAETLKSRVTAITQQNTQLFQISVIDPDPARAAALANSIATVLIADQQQTLQQRNLFAEQNVERQIAATQAQIQSETAKLHDPQTSQADAAGLKADLQALQAAYQQYLTTQSQLQVQDGLNAILLTVKVPATPDSHPIRPLILVNGAVGFTCGLLLGVLSVLVQGQVDPRVRSAEELAALLGYPILVDATVAPQGVFNGRRSASARGRRQPAINWQETLQKAVEFLSIDRPIRSVAVTGVQDSAAASVIGAAWALHLARSGTRTLIVDADLQHPRLAAHFGVDASGGLSDAALALRHGEPATAVLHRYLIPGAHIGAPALSLMPSGTPPPKPGQVLESQAMGLLFSTLLSTESEFAIFNTPSARERVLASSFETSVDGVVIVIEVARAHRPQLRQLKTQMAQTEARVLGLVIVTRELVQGTFGPSRPPSSSGAPRQHAPTRAAGHLLEGPGMHQRKQL